MTELFTIGYEGLDPKRFFALLSRCGVEMLVDVRDLPVSRKKGFSKATLSGLCEQNEIEYRHIPALGCPRDIRHGYREDGDWANYTVHFKAYLAQQSEAVAEVAKLAGKRRICLLCFEEDFNFCHRTYVAEATAPLVGGDVKISHLTGPIKGRVVEWRESVAA
jgi:uncharacterized protein (DUF488 family)